MSCEEARDLLHWYLDNELDLGAALGFERHLRDCAACERAYANQQTLRSAIRSQAPYFKAPARLGRKGRPMRRSAPVTVAASVTLMIAGTWTTMRTPALREPVAPGAE